jgi:carboxyl-terminal processing protease
MKRIACIMSIVALACTALPAAAAQTCPASFSAADAWTEVRQELSENYAYWDRIAANAAFDAATPALLAAPDRLQFADRLDTLLLLFRDSHVHVSPTSEPAAAWVPSAADLWFASENGRLVVQDVKGGSQAQALGIRPGWELVAIEGRDPRQAVRERFAAIGITPDADQEIYAVNAMASGRLKQQRHMTFRAGGKLKTTTLPPGYSSVQRPATPLTVTIFGMRSGPTVAVIRINNSLGDNALIADFDAAVAVLPVDTRIVIDMRDTPSGGNTTVARAIIGHFITEPQPYQRHELTYERVKYGVPRTWIEYVEPRKATRTAPVVLAGLWTGSMGEGIVIGLNAAAHAPVVGSPMGHLLGAMIEDELPKACLKISFANEKLWHVDGRPREDFVPDVMIAPADTAADGSDAALNEAVKRARM